MNQNQINHVIEQVESCNADQLQELLHQLAYTIKEMGHEYDISCEGDDTLLSVAACLEQAELTWMDRKGN